MKTPIQLLHLALLVLVLGCATNDPAPAGNPERGRDGTVAYYVSVEASESGVRIEANEDYIGTAPLTLKIFGDKDGTFHNFGSPEYVIRAFPTKPGQYPQTKVFRTGKWFQPEDMIPKRIYFDMQQPSSGTGAAPPPPGSR